MGIHDSTSALDGPVQPLLVVARTRSTRLKVSSLVTELVLGYGLHGLMVEVRLGVMNAQVVTVDDMQLEFELNRKSHAKSSNNISWYI